MHIPLLLAAAAASVLAVPSPSCRPLPQEIQFTSNPKLPDPLTLFNGDPVRTKSDWDCRRSEISQLFQRYELGTLPPRPQSLTASFSNGTLTVNVSENGKSISFTVGITFPSTGKGPFPAVIGIGGTSMPFPDGLARITFNNNDIAQQTDQSSRGKGKFFTLYGADHSAGALMAWTWGISRVIDALEMTTGHNINLKKLAVTGCSRNGKGAFVAGAFEERIALTLVQESGSGGAGCWRISDDMLKKQNITTQTASEIVQENVWFSTNFNPFVDQVTVLPFDHHMLAGLVAPRGLLVIDNTGIDWLGPESVWGCQLVGRKIYDALGITTSMGITQQSHANSHCSLPTQEAPDVADFVNRFLKDLPEDTDIVNTDGANNVGFVEADYVNWSVPHL